jgi:NTE family protein
MKTVVLFQGGGALGAFGCGAWKVISARLAAAGDELVAVGGTSIGAINAALVARHYGNPDRRCAALEQFWRSAVATPSFPFLGMTIGWPARHAWAARIRSWNGVLTGLLLGNRLLYRPAYGHWNPLAGLLRAHLPLFDRTGFVRAMGDFFGAYRSSGNQPLLVVPAVDVLSGDMVLFDSDEEVITPKHLEASSAVPILFAVVEIDGRSYWDGDVTRHSLIRPMLDRLQLRGRIQPGEPLQIITVEQAPQPLAQPAVTGVELAYRAMNLLQLDKLDPAALPMDGGTSWRRVQHQPLPNDAVSGHFDYSPERIEALIAEGQGAGEADESVA